MTQEISSYITAQPSDLQPRLRCIYETIHAAAPLAEERISHRMPCFYIGKTFLCGFAAFKNHTGFYPGGIVGSAFEDEALKAFAERLANYKTGKGTVQFPHNKEIDFELIADILAWRLAHK